MSKVLVILSNDQEKVEVSKESEVTSLVYKSKEKLSFEDETFESVFSNVSDELLLKEAFRVLKKDGKIITNSNSDLDLMMSGFIEVEKMENEKFTAKKPSYDSNTAFSLKSKEKKTTWKLTMDDDNEDEDGLINEDDLLEEDDLKKPVVKEKCSTQKKACKNCTCGRAEGKIVIENTDDIDTTIFEEQQKKGGCGSCALGDAFRCSSCPYLGMPSFKPGEKVQIKL
eukprot:gene8699-646_t